MHNSFPEIDLSHKQDSWPGLARVLLLASNQLAETGETLLFNSTNGHEPPVSRPQHFESCPRPGTFFDPGWTINKQVQSLVG